MALLVALLVIAPTLGGGYLLASPGAEVYGHAWVQWWHATALPQWPNGPGDLLPAMPVWTVIDLVPTALASLVGRMSGVAGGWNTTVFAAVAAAALGGAALARRVDGDATVGALALALAPSLQGAIASGLTEDLFVGIPALGLAWLGRPGRGRALASGVALGLTAACGLVLAWGAALAAAVVGAGVLWRDRSRWRLVGLSAGTALVTAAPVVVLHAARLTGHGHRSGLVQQRVEPLWQLNPWHGADLLSFVTPGTVDWGGALLRLHPGYLGWSLILLGLLGRARIFAALAALFVVLAPGAEFAVAGQPTGIANPFHAAVSLLPFGSLLNHRARLVLFAALALAAVASQGAQRIAPRWRWAVWIAVVLDCALLSPVGLPLPTVETPHLRVFDCHEASSEQVGVPRCLDDFAPGMVLHLPMAGPGIHFQRPLLLQAVHGRPIFLNPNQPGLPPDQADTPTGRWLSGLAFSSPPSPPDAPTLPPGVSVLVVEEPFVDAVSAVFGEPPLRRSDSAVWGPVSPP